MRRLLQSVSIVAALAASGMAWAQQPANPPANPVANPAQPTEPAPEAPKEPAASPPVVTLVEAGAEPRSALRLTPKVGQEQGLKMRMLMSMSMKMDEQAFPSQSIPAILMTLTTKVASVAAEGGDINYDIEFKECGLEEGGETPPEVADMMKQAIAPLAKVTGSCVISSRGVNKDAKIVAPPGIDPGAASMLDNMKQQIGQMGTPFPEEAVGAGAKWKVATKIKSQGVQIDQTATIELVELKDGVAKMNVSIEQTAANQKINPPGLPEGATLEVQSLKSTGSGKLEQPLGSVAPNSSAMKMATDMSMKVDGGGESHSMTQHIGIELTMSPATAVATEKADKPAETPATK